MTLSRDNVEVPISSYEEFHDMLASGEYRMMFDPNGAYYQLHVENNDTEIMRRIGTALRKYPSVMPLVRSQVSSAQCTLTK